MRIKIYDPKAWLPFLFHFHKEKLFRRLRPIVILMIIYAAIISAGEYFLHDYYSIISDFAYLGQFHLLFNFVLSIMIAFRVNTAYARWWEGRGLWGQLTNNARNLGFKFEAFIGLNQYPVFKECLLRFPELLKYHLRRERDKCEELIGEIGLKYSSTDHLPNLVLKEMHKIINTCRIENKISLEQYLALSANLDAFADVLGGCEKILNTPVPLSFNVLIKQALFFYMLIFPFGWAGTFGFFVIPMIIVMIYVLWGLEALADELEDPFGYDDNDLPLDAMSATIAGNLAAIADNQELF